MKGHTAVSAVTIEEQRAGAGFEFLTGTVGPGWWWDIDLGNLDMAYSGNVLTQLGAGPGRLNDWTGICRVFGISPYGTGPSPTDVELGLNAEPSTPGPWAMQDWDTHPPAPGAYTRLEEAWRQRILAAKAKDAAR